jgi:hypothetical protein
MEYGKTSAGRDSPARDLAIIFGDLPKHKASSSTPPPHATSDDGVAEMMGRLRLTSQESDAFVL